MGCSSRATDQSDNLVVIYRFLSLFSKNGKSLPLQGESCGSGRA